MRQTPATPVYIICSPRPLVGKTLIARLLSEFLQLKDGTVIAFDVNLKEPSLLDYLPDLTETAEIGDTFGKMALMDRVIMNDGIAKVIDLGFHAFDEFFKMTDEIGFMKEAARRGVAPVVLFVGDTDRVSARSYPMLQRQIPRRPRYRRQRIHRSRRIAAGLCQRAAFSTGRAAEFSQVLCRADIVLVHRLLAERKGLLDRAASMDPQQLFQAPRA
jgi:hypothetical protein